MDTRTDEFVRKQVCKLPLGISPLGEYFHYALHLLSRSCELEEPVPCGVPYLIWRLFDSRVLANATIHRVKQFGKLLKAYFRRQPACQSRTRTVCSRGFGSPFRWSSGEQVILLGETVHVLFVRERVILRRGFAFLLRQSYAEVQMK